MYIFNAYNLMSLDICKHMQTHMHMSLNLWNHHQNQGNRQIPHVPTFPYVLLTCFAIKTHNMRSTLLTSFEVHNTILQTIGTMLYTRSLELTHLAWLKPYTHWTIRPQCPHPSANLYCILCLYEFDCYTCLIKVESGTSCPSVTGLFQLA